jgi:hypothetical protein
VKDSERIKERFLRDPIEIRLAGIASDLARVASSARRNTGSESVLNMLEESQYFIEWTAAELEPEIAGELAALQVEIALWRRAWQSAQQNPSQRSLLSIQAKRWSNQLLLYSGLTE